MQLNHTECNQSILILNEIDESSKHFFINKCRLFNIGGIEEKCPILYWHSQPKAFHQASHIK